MLSDDVELASVRSQLADTSSEGVFEAQVFENEIDSDYEDYDDDDDDDDGSVVDDERVRDARDDTDSMRPRIAGNYRRSFRKRKRPTRRRKRSHEKRSSVAKVIEFVSLDEIQKQLNNMDDHLEVLRSMQAASLVFVSLSAFFANGALFLFIYTLLTSRKAYYHGTILTLTSINYILIVLFCYIGDRLAYYGLGAFVQTVEDEYFLQGESSPQVDCGPESGSNAVKRADESRTGGNPLDTSDNTSSTLAMESSTSVSNSNHNNNKRALSRRDLLHMQQQQQHQRQQQKLLINRKDVLFCREFLHQFENHLATPWTKLTVKTHLHIMGTFVTLIAAQIIFDHEH